MEMLEQVWDFAELRIAPHFPMIVYAFAFAFLGQIAKRFVWTEKNIRKLAGLRDRLWNAGGIKRVPALLLKVSIAIPVPLHPLLAGLFIALFPIPISGFDAGSYVHRAFYMVAAALCSLALYDVLHGVLKRKGLDFKFPGEPSIVPPPPDKHEDDTARL